jgi:hypothetical protein
MHHLNNSGRGIEGHKGSAFRAVILFGGQQGPQLFPELAPGLILVAAGHGVGKEGERHGTEAGEAPQDLPFVRRCRLLRLFNPGERADCRENVAGLGFLPACHEGEIIDIGQGLHGVLTIA